MSCSGVRAFRHQRGSALIVAIFVIVVMSAMAAAMLRVSGSSQDMTTREVLSTRAWFTAHSANDYMMSRLFAVEPANQASCASLDGESFALPGGLGCSAVQSCQETLSPEAGAPTTYLLISTARCGSGPHAVTRIQELWAKELVNE
ncbi:hypothetical protein [Photobacterium sp. 1_MG-2023]|uniref:hypothetical protein n=1 Tax=Photobacterium sp. 1_MG-2023 TaxID=3062646 RepID=UPI0026E29B72|nr:hypothetical protein [Photobacterium sp. 1_MG-2023]MDO6706389.1 hypothetical protein [Photobacterium sp. 1_MG-2023]